MGLANLLTKATGLVLVASFVAPGLAAPCTVLPAIPTAVIPQGTIKGFRDSSSNSVFLGIPFAATTGGENRYVRHTPDLQHIYPCVTHANTVPPDGEHLRTFPSPTQASARPPMAQHALRPFPVPFSASRARTA